MGHLRAVLAGGGWWCSLSFAAGTLWAIWRRWGADS